MKNRAIRIFLVLAVAIIGFSAFGCGGIPMPKEKEKYTTWVEHIKLPDDMEEEDQLSIVHVNFDIDFRNSYYDGEKTVLVSKDELQGYFDECSADGSCGTTAYLNRGDKNVKSELVSSSCEFGDLIDNADKTKYILKTNCSVPILGSMKEGKTYMLKLITISPDLSKDDPSEKEHVYINGDDGSISPKHNLVFTSSPKFKVVDNKLVFTKVFAQQQ